MRLALNATLHEVDARCGCPTAAVHAADGCGGVAVVSFSALMREPRAALGALLARPDSMWRARTVPRAPAKIVKPYLVKPRVACTPCLSNTGFARS